MSRLILYNDQVGTGLRAWLAGLCLAPLVAACAGGGDGAQADQEDDRLQVLASFYPLQYVAQRVAGERGSVRSLTEPGAEPHDVELTPRDVAGIGEADLLIYLGGGFQPSVDDAAAQAAERALDVAPTARLDLTYTPIEDGEREQGEAGSVDPHFWLDPTRLADVADAVADRLGQQDGGGAATFAANATALRDDLEALDGELRAGLAGCRNRNLVTSHNAFGYLAARYGLRQVGITGLTPEQEPSPADLARVAAFVRDNQVRTIYSETLVSPAVANTLASDTRARTAVLDPLEGPAEGGASDYLQAMRTNLATLRDGQPCP